MHVVVVLTHAPLQGGHFQEAQRSAMMFSGLGHRVSFVLMDEGVLSLLEGSGYGFGLKKLGRLQGIDDLGTFVVESSMKRLVPDAVMDGLQLITDSVFAKMLGGSKVVVF